MGDDEKSVIADLSQGDCLFQPQQEAFFVVTDTDEDSVHFAIHGWRTIGKERLERYLSEENRQSLLTEEELREYIEDEEAEERLDRLKDMVFTVYADEEKYADTDES